MPVITIFLYVFFCISGFLQAMQPSAAKPQQVMLAHKKRSADELFAMIPQSMSTRPLVHLNALLEQTDNFSCVYRSLFHAQCISLALERAILGEYFESNLKRHLIDETLLNRTYGHVKNYLDQHDPYFDRTKGLRINHLLGVIASSIPLLEKKILPVILENNTVYAVKDPTPALPSPLYYSTDFIRNYYGGAFSTDRCHVEIDQSAQLKHQLSRLEKPNQVAHFACRFPSHIFIASIITDQRGYAKLYVIDSNNNSLEREEFKPFVCKIVEYAERHNAQFSQHLDKKMKKR